MARLDAFRRLPSLVALETLPVLTGHKRGASIQITETFLENRLTVLETLDSEVFAAQTATVRESRDSLTVDMSVRSFDSAALQDAAGEIRSTFREIPTVSMLQDRYPGDSVVVPDLLMTEGQLSVGLRVFFFQANDAPAAGDIIRENVSAVINDEQRAFERYIGELHGYPDCCISQFTDRPPDAPSPEVRSLDPLASTLQEAILGRADVSIQDIVTDFWTYPDAYAFFSRKFFPDPECQTARDRGTEMFHALTGELPEPLVRDYFRLNYALNYTVTKTLMHEDATHPAVGTLGREHLYLYLPLSGTLDVSRYDETE